MYIIFIFPHREKKGHFYLLSRKWRVLGPGGVWKGEDSSVRKLRKLKIYTTDPPLHISNLSIRSL